MSAIGRRSIASSSGRVMRTSVCSPGSATGIDASVSTDSASLASTQSWRSRAIPASTGGIGAVERLDVELEGVGHM